MLFFDIFMYRGIIKIILIEFQSYQDIQNTHIFL